MTASRKNPTPNDEDILHAIAGDDAARTRILEYLHERLPLRIVTRTAPYILQKTDVEDFVQEALLIVNNNFPNLRTTTLRGLNRFVAVVLDRLIAKAAKRLERMPPELPMADSWVSDDARMLPIADASPTPPREFARRERIIMILDCLASLKERHRRIIQLCLFDELGPTESAGVLGIAPKAAAQLYIRAMDNLKLAVSKRRNQRRRAESSSTLES